MIKNHFTDAKNHHPTVDTRMCHVKASYISMASMEKMMKDKWCHGSCVVLFSLTLIFVLCHVKCHLKWTLTFAAKNVKSKMLKKALSELNWKKCAFKSWETLIDQFEVIVHLIEWKRWKRPHRKIDYSPFCTVRFPLLFFLEC